MPSHYASRVSAPVPTSAASLSTSTSTVPSELQSATADLLSLHSAIDSALVRLDSCTSLATLSAASLEVKQRVAQLQLRLTAVQAEVEARQSRQQLTNQSQQASRAAASDEGDDDSGERPVVAGSGGAGTESIEVLLSHHRVLAGSYSNTLRQRILACRAQLAAQQQAVRGQLFDSARQQPAAAQAVSVSATTAAADRQRQFTASLQHTAGLLQSSLSLSASSLSSLSSSTDSLRSTQRQSAVHSESVKGGSKLITKQMLRQRTDRLLVWCGLAFFLLVCAYITNRRLRISRIVAFVTRTLLPDMQWYQHTPTQQQQYQQWHERETTEELSVG